MRRGTQTYRGELWIVVHTVSTNIGVPVDFGYMLIGVLESLLAVAAPPPSR